MPLYKLSEKDKAAIAKRKRNAKFKEAKEKLKYTAVLKRPAFYTKVQVRTKKALNELKRANDNFWKVKKASDKFEAEVKALNLAEEELPPKILGKLKKLRGKRAEAYANMDVVTKKHAGEAIVKEYRKIKGGTKVYTHVLLDDENYVLSKGESARCVLKVLKPIKTDSGNEYHEGGMIYQLIYANYGKTVKETLSIQRRPEKYGEDYILESFVVEKVRIYRAK